MAITTLEETTSFRPNFNEEGLIACIVQDTGDGAVLMFAWMNVEALEKTQATGLMHFYSRSRKKLWLKGETSGEKFALVELLVDCDQDCLLARVEAEGKGNACHTGRKSCFYRAVEGGGLSFE